MRRLYELPVLRAPGTLQVPFGTDKSFLLDIKSIDPSVPADRLAQEDRIMSVSHSKVNGTVAFTQMFQYEFFL